VPAVHFGKIKPGQVVNVKPDLAQMEQQSAKVIVVDRVIDPASNSFRVRLELPNPDNALPPGLRCKVDFELGPVAAAPAAKASPAPGAKAAPEAPAVKPAAEPGPKAQAPLPPANTKPAVAQVNAK
jgi:multidrug efflux pump subunit AcrA (membrane-fusion protein)